MAIDDMVRQEEKFLFEKYADGIIVKAEYNRALGELYRETKKMVGSVKKGGTKQWAGKISR